ncbi:MAG: extracellular solute-binding protein [Clostridia bacterium]|nr:extracellular solute-binding protein [Clostridia bacterium]
MKKALSVFLSVLMLLSVCLAAQADAVTLKVWDGQDDQEILKELCEAYAAAHPENTYTFEYGVVGTADASARYLEDPAAAADVFVYPDDQLIRLVQADALYEVTRNHDEIVAANSQGSVNAASWQGTLYGYPETSDNGYFLFYDKSVLTEEDVKTLDGILAAAEKAGKKFNFDVANGWYIASFFIGNGCEITLDENGNQVCDFNNEKGLAAAEAVQAMCNHPAFLPGDQNILTGTIGENVCAGVCGTWVADAVKERLGDNYAACKLPTFTCGGEQVQMGSFGGCKILGVNTQSANPVEAMQLAEFLTCEASQLRRFEVRGYGPSNNAVAAGEAVAADPALAALAAQSEYAITQLIIGDFWTPATAFGNELIANEQNDLQTLLDQWVAQTVAQ